MSDIEGSIRSNVGSSIGNSIEFSKGSSIYGIV